jgi:hypothetical protein
MTKPWPPETVAGNPTCRTTHWSLPAACAQPRGHHDNWHLGWTGPNGTRGRKLYRWRHTVGVTELMVGKIWQPTSIPGLNQLAPRLTDEQITTELAPLAAVIQCTLNSVPVRLGDTADLTAALTLAVAAYMGPLVGDVPALLAKNARLRARVGELLQDAATLAALYAGGVDNWDGYDAALEG